MLEEGKKMLVVDRSLHSIRPISQKSYLSLAALIFWQRIMCVLKEVWKYSMNSFTPTEPVHYKKGYWINELESLGISPKKINDYLNNGKNWEEVSIAELADLVENIKQTMYQEYKTAFSERMTELEDETGEAEEYSLSARYEKKRRQQNYEPY